MHPSAQSAWQERPQNVLDVSYPLVSAFMSVSTVGLSKKGRNVSPQHTKILVTNLAELMLSQVVCMYQKEQHIALALMIPLVMKMLHILRQRMAE